MDSIPVVANLAPWISTFPLLIKLSLFLSPPVTTFLIVLADAQSFAQLLTLINLRPCQLVDLMALQSPRTRSTAAFLGLQLFP